MGKENKTKYIFECTAPGELTEFNRDYNKKIHDWCDRDKQHKFKPDIACMMHSSDMMYCKYLRLHKYKGEK